MIFTGCGSDTAVKDSDRQAPVIHLIGASEIVLYVSDTYEELGAEAVDDMDGDISKDIVISTDLNTQKVGRYTVTYSVSDEVNNNASISRMVIVKVNQDDLNSTMIVDSSRTDTFILLHDDTPSGAYYTYEEDALALHSDGIKNSFHILGYETDEKYNWGSLPSHQNKYNLSWEGRFDDEFIIYVVLKFQTIDGKILRKDLVYTPSENGYEDYTFSHMHIFLGEDSNDGTWRHFERNILDDLHSFYPGAVINSTNIYDGYLNGIAVRGTGSITNMYLYP